MNSLYKLGAIYDGDFTQTEEQLRALANQEGEPVLFLPCGTISNHFDADNNNGNLQTLSGNGSPSPARTEPDGLPT